MQAENGLVVDDADVHDFDATLGDGREKTERLERADPLLLAGNTGGLAAVTGACRRSSLGGCGTETRSEGESGNGGREFDVHEQLLCCGDVPA